THWFQKKVWCIYTSQSVIGNAWLAVQCSFLSRNENNAIIRPGAIDCSCSCVFKNGDTFDIGGVQGIDVAANDPIDHNKRAVLIQRSDSTNIQVDCRTRLRAWPLNVQIRRYTSQFVSELHDRPTRDLLLRFLDNDTCQTRLCLGAISNNHERAHHGNR